LMVLVACEFSGVVREAFARRGHDAWSCDLLDTEIPGKHIQGDVLKVLGEGWDLMIAHPPCTHLAACGARWFYRKKDLQEDALKFVKQLMDAPILRICVENPVSIISTRIRRPDQIIQPYWFGESISKKTCLWLKNLPILTPTKIVDKGEFITFSSGRRMSKWCAETWGKGHERSRTFVGIAEAMAEQWG